MVEIPFPEVQMRLVQASSGQWEVQQLGHRGAGSSSLGDQYIRKRHYCSSLEKAVHTLVHLWPLASSSAAGVPIRDLQQLLVCYQRALRTIEKSLSLDCIIKLPPGRCNACGRFYSQHHTHTCPQASDNGTDF